MVKQRTTLDALFYALSDPTRRAILERLAQGEATMTEVVAPFDQEMEWSAVTKHVQILEKTGLVVRRREGRTHHLSLTAAPMRDALDWLSHYRAFWEQQFDHMERILEEQKQEHDDDHSTPDD